MNLHSQRGPLVGEFKTALPQKASAHELDKLAQLNNEALNLAAAWMNRGLTCSHCKRCTGNCEVLNDPNVDIGEMARYYRRIAALSETDQVTATLEFVQSKPQLYHALRRCCFCGYCTSTCAAHQHAPEVMRGWRELFAKANIMNPNDSRLVMVDNQWDIFSAYRAIYGIGYPEFLDLEAVAEQGPGVVDTVLFPGCSLVSYTPQLVRSLGQWLNSCGIKWALSTHCCGSPLMSAGLFDRAQGLRLRVIDQLQKAGVKRFLTVCPGCGEEFGVDMPKDIDIIPLPEFMLYQLERNADAPQAGPMAVPESFAVFDSCHDRRDNRHGLAIRKLLMKLLPECERKELHHKRKLSLCCGAGGAVAGYDGEITARRVGQVLEEGHASGAETLVTMCPTCAYTVGQANLERSSALEQWKTMARESDGPLPSPMKSHHYLELVFGLETSWAEIFGNLESMWSGQYGPWLNETFFA